jgi:HK97 family phage prohead protease/HK97 family phage major capsid protein
MSDNLTDILQIEVPLDDAAVQVRDESKRELDIRVVPWGVTINTTDGTEEFVRGAFDGAEPSRIKLMGLEHAAQLGIGHDGKPRLTRVPTGKGIAYEDREDGAYMTFRVSKTAAGDDQLALATDGIVTGASIEFMRVDGGTVTEKRGSRRHNRHVRADLRGVTTTYQPAYEGAQVLAVRSEEEPVTEQAAPEVPAAPDIEARIASSITPFKSEVDAQFAKLFERMDAQDEQARARFELPAAPLSDDAANQFKGEGIGDWASVVLRTMSGEKIPQRELEARLVADLITADNLGVVPEQFLPEMIGIIDAARPFLDSTRKLNIPAAGLSMTVPVITTRPTVGVQAEEKDELTSTATSITDTSFTPTTIGGYGDVSLQLLRRSDPSYLQLYLELLNEAYAVMADDRAVDSLLAAAGITAGGEIVPSDGPQFGVAWENAAAVSRRLAPDTVWLSSQAVALFIDAQSSTTNAPLYANLAGNFTASGGAGGTISGLRPVHVPALDDEAADVIVGPSRGFAWAEDGTFTLQVDVPARAGRDVALVGMIWNMPLYPAAFTTFTVAAS